jgi:hypothetical protein
MLMAASWSTLPWCVISSLSSKNDPFGLARAPRPVEPAGAQARRLIADRIWGYTPAPDHPGIAALGRIALDPAPD